MSHRQRQRAASIRMFTRVPLCYADPLSPLERLDQRPDGCQPCERCGHVATARIVVRGDALPGPRNEDGSRPRLPDQGAHVVCDPCLSKFMVMARPWAAVLLQRFVEGQQGKTDE